MNGFIPIERKLDQNSPVKTDEMIKAGFWPDTYYDVYVKTGYGAIMFNIDKDIKSVEELRTHYDPVCKDYVYKSIAEEAKKRGMVLVIGPAMPLKDGTIPDAKGLYCENYVAVASREKPLKVPSDSPKTRRR